MVKDVSPKQNALKKPDDFELIYNSKKSIFYYGVSIWRPKCPDNYIALGYVVNRGYDMPMRDGTNFRCVSLSIVVTSGGKWKGLWNDVNSGAKMDGGIWRADVASIRGDSVGVWSVFAMANYGTMDIAQPPLLKAANVSLRFQKPIRSVTIKNLVYDIKNMHIISQGPSDITRGGGRTIVSNCGE